VLAPQLQSRVIEFVAAINLPQEEKLAVQAWLVQNGSAEGRLAASSILSSLDSGAVEQIIFNSLNSGEESIQAWATSQLRPQHIPETFSLLIERLDSPLEAVREAAREELSSFNVDMLLGIFDHLDPEICRRAGELTLKIDPECCFKLSRELAHPVCRNRIRAARAARMLGLHRRVLPALLAMLEHSDSLVRRTAVEVLDDVATREVIMALERLHDDPSPRVRETVAASLRKLCDQAGLTLPHGS
jgi:HEAT repeat protein